MKDTLSPKERKHWQATIDGWHNDLTETEAFKKDRRPDWKALKQLRRDWKQDLKRLT